MDEVEMGFLIGKLLTVLIEQSIMAVKVLLKGFNVSRLIDGLGIFSTSLLPIPREVQVRYSN